MVIEVNEERVSLSDLALQGVDALLEQLGLAMPDAENQVPVAAFNSSI